MIDGVDDDSPRNLSMTPRRGVVFAACISVHVVAAALGWDFGIPGNASVFVLADSAGQVLPHRDGVVCVATLRRRHHQFPVHAARGYCDCAAGAGKCGRADMPENSGLGRSAYVLRR